MVPPSRTRPGFFCPGPGQKPGTTCGLPSSWYSDFLCEGHHKQMARTGKLRPLRSGLLERLPGTALRVSPSARKAVLAKAKAAKLSPSEVLRRIIEEWASK
jgi:hypothetical protein